MMDNSMKHFAISSVTVRASRRRLGFTLIELLMVIAVIALLLGLLFPAISSIWRGGRVAEVQKEIKDLTTALEQFKEKFHEYPPSRITLYGTKTGWFPPANAPAAVKAEARRSVAIIRKFWPDFDFNGDSMGENADGAGGTFLKATPFVRLDGAECLVFFLGGVRDEDGVHVGFSSNEAQPFTLKDKSRVGPFFKFDPSRLVHTDTDGFFEYKDPMPDQTQPYIYLSSYEGQGYQKLDLDTDGDASTTGDSRMESYYIQPSSNPNATTGWNPQKFQIISPGQDGKYGKGGLYDPDNAGFGGDREAERDNITNFSAGLLEG